MSCKLICTLKIAYFSVFDDGFRVPDMVKYKHQIGTANEEEQQQGYAANLEESMFPYILSITK